MTERAPGLVPRSNRPTPTSTPPDTGTGWTTAASSATSARASASCATASAGSASCAPREGGEIVLDDLRALDRLLRRSDREEAAEPLPARHADPLVRHRRLQPRLQVLPELGHLEVARDRHARRRGRRRRRSRDAARALGCRSVAFTYNDPIDLPRVRDRRRRRPAARAASRRSPSPPATSARSRAREFYAHMDAANVDLKAFTEEFYRKVCGGQLEPVLETLVYLAHETDVWFEITTLLIPGENDSDAELDRDDALDRRRARARRAAALHRLPSRLPDARPSRRRRRRRSPARGGSRWRTALRYVYTGNVHDGNGGRPGARGCGGAVDRPRRVRDHRLEPRQSPRCPRLRRLRQPDRGRFEARPGTGAPAAMVALHLRRSLLTERRPRGTFRGLDTPRSLRPDPSMPVPAPSSCDGRSGARGRNGPRRRRQDRRPGRLPLTAIATSRLLIRRIDRWRTLYVENRVRLLRPDLGPGVTARTRSERKEDKLVAALWIGTLIACLAAHTSSSHILNRSDLTMSGNGYVSSPLISSSLTVLTEPLRTWQGSYEGRRRGLDRSSQRLERQLYRSATSAA